VVYSCKREGGVRGRLAYKNPASITKGEIKACQLNRTKMQQPLCFLILGCKIRPFTINKVKWINILRRKLCFKFQDAKFDNNDKKNFGLNFRMQNSTWLSDVFPTISILRAEEPRIDSSRTTTFKIRLSEKWRGNKENKFFFDLKMWILKVPWIFSLCSSMLVM